MKIIIYVFFMSIFLYADHVYAFGCQYLDGRKIDAHSTSYIDVEISSSIVDTPPDGYVNEYANLANHIQCINHEPGVATDYLFMDSFTVPLDSPAVDFGVKIKGVNYFDQLLDRTEVFIIPRGNGSWIPLELGLILKITDVPNDGVLIRAGQELVRMEMWHYGTYFWAPDTPHNPYGYTWVIRATNDIILTSSSCIINDNQPVYVDLGELYLRNIATTSGSKTNSQPLNISLKCPDAPTYSGEVEILLAGDQSSFMNTALATRDGSAYGGGGNIIPDLGVEISGASTGAITPNATSSPVKAMINNGVGNAALMVTPVKDANATYLGDFNAVGTLIMSLP